MINTLFSSSPAIVPFLLLFYYFFLIFLIYLKNKSGVVTCGGNSLSFCTMYLKEKHDDVGALNCTASIPRRTLGINTYRPKDTTGRDAVITFYSLRSKRVNNFEGVVYNSPNEWVLEPGGRVEIRAGNQGIHEVLQKAAPLQPITQCLNWNEWQNNQFPHMWIGGYNGIDEEYLIHYLTLFY